MSLNSEKEEQPTRLNTIVRTVGYSLVAKVLSVTLSLVSVPIALGYLGKDGYGIWATVTSFVGFLVFADLGVGNGMLNGISNANARSDFVGVRRIAASGAVSVAGVSLILLLAFASSWPFVNWSEMLAISDAEQARQGALAMLALVIVFAANMPISLVQKIQYGMQAGQWASISQGLSAVFNVLMILAVTYFDLGLVGMVICLITASMTADLCNGYMFFRERPLIKPSLLDFDIQQSKALLRVGLGFLFLQVSVALCYASDNFIVAHLLDHEAVTEYAIHQRLLSPISFIAALALTPLWPAFADATARGDKAWIKRALLYTCGLMLIAGAVGGGAIVFSSDWLLLHWLNGEVHTNRLLAIALVVWITIDLVGRAIAMFLNGAGLLKEQVAIVLVFVPLCIGLKLYFTKAFGLPGLVFGTAVAWVIVNVPAYTLILVKWARGADSDVRP